ncbi:hypothetical protein GOV12_05645 [Candidatus Pacearchaeota archaeon]|nr:hypothetical protein [Candidatus Pacearchaeota archaeon]
MKNIIRYTIATILIIIILAIITTFLINYNVNPIQTFQVDSENLITDGNFENFNDTANDCCNSASGNASFFSTPSTDSQSDEYSLNLTSYNHCACINKEINDFTNDSQYLISFYYKGNNPRYCNWVLDDKKCLSELDLNKTDTWTINRDIVTYTSDSISSSIFFYADSKGEPTTNLYDSLSVNRLFETSFEEIQEQELYEQEFAEFSGIETGYGYGTQPNQYVILTRSDNQVKNAEFLSSAEEGFSYYLIEGQPEITLKFPYTELIIIIILIVIVIRLLFKKSEYELKKIHSAHHSEHQESKEDIRESFNQ